MNQLIRNFSKNKLLKTILQPWWLFSLIGLVFGVFYATQTPLLWGTDETAHFARVYQIAHRHVMPPRLSNGAYGGPLPKNLIGLWDLTKSDLLDNKGGGIFSRKDVDSRAAYDRFGSQHFSIEQGTSPGSAVYSAFAYPAPIVGVVVAHFVHATIGQTIIMARISSLLLYIAMVAFALRVLSRSSLKWLFFVVAALPICVYQASVVTADSMAIGLSIVFMALLVRLLQNRKKITHDRLFYALMAVAVYLPLVKANYLFLSLSVVLLPTKLFKTPKLSIIIKAAGAVAIGVTSLVSLFLGMTTSATAVSQRPDGALVDASTQTVFIIHHPLFFLVACIKSAVINIDAYIQSMTSLTGWNYVSPPWVFVSLLSLGVIFAGLYGKKEIRHMRTQLVWLTVFSLLGILSIYAALYVAYNPIGNHTVDGVQGRYFLPLMIPLILLIASYLPLEVNMRERAAARFFPLISGVCLLASAVYYYGLTY